MNPKDMDTRPQLSMIRAIQTRAPKRTNQDIGGNLELGNSPIKKTPAPKPKATSDMPRNSFI